jgi:hypothetical protein
MRRLKLVLGLASAVLLGGVTAASAVPTLQLYIDGASYDPLTETWITVSNTFDLWVLGVSPVSDVKLSAAYMTGETGSISLAPTTAGDFAPPAGDDDTSTPAIPFLNYSSADGEIPVRGDNTLLPSHGIYGPGVSFLEFNLGNFTLTDSPIGDYQGIPSSFPDVGQINVYTVTINGFDSGIHFDAYDHTVTGHGGAQVKYVFAPFSHDAQVPEPSAAALLLIGLAGLGWIGHRTRKH